jgi:hypothetical protein
MAAEPDFDIPGPIGIQDIEVEQSFTKINTNRTLVLASLLMEGPYDPEVIPEAYTGSLTGLFDYLRKEKKQLPAVEVELETGDDDDPTQSVTVTYDSLKSFRPDELEKRLAVLQRQKAQVSRFQKIRAEVERSKRLQEIIRDPQKRAAFLEILESIREELTENE